MTITAVAIQFRGVVYSLPAPNRHSAVRQMLRKQFPDVFEFDMLPNVAGFLDSDGRFLNRKQAGAVAVVAGQVRAGTLRLGELTSEDLW